MKYLATLLFLPTLVLAQAPENQAQPQQTPHPQPVSFEQYKKSMQPIVEQSLPLMRETRECVSKATTQEATEECMLTNTKKVFAMQEKMGGPTAQTQQDPVKLSKFPEGFEWNLEANQKILHNMDNAIQRNTIALECMSVSNSREEMANCMRSKMPQQPTPQQ